MANALFKTKDVFFIVGSAIILFIATTLLSNYYLKSGPEIIHFGFPFCFYSEYGGYMAQQHGSNMNYFVFDILITLGFTFVIYTGAKLLFRFFASGNK